MQHTYISFERFTQTCFLFSFLSFFFPLALWQKKKILSFFLWGSYMVQPLMRPRGRWRLSIKTLTDLGTSYAAHMTGSPEIPKTKAEVSHMATSLAGSLNSFKWTQRPL